MKRFVNIALLLCVFISCSNRDLKEYLNQGFATPTFENDVYFSDCAEGEGKKIYVPSGKDVKVRLAITNTYNKELRATLTFPEADAYLFKKVPCITNLDFTSLIISFEFKKDAEPEASNGFLGMSVPIELKLFDVKRGRHLGTRVIKANCNTAPLAIDESAITYDLQEDEYTIHLPKNEGKHNDLKEVRLELSTKQGNGEVKHKVVSIDKAEEQDKDYVLKVKDFLQQASGMREIKVTVFDKAGIPSTVKNKKGELIFLNITLQPSTKQIDIEESRKKGICVPEIKELKEYFKEAKDWKDAEYKVEYVLPAGKGFVYDEESNTIKNTSAVIGEHEVKVILKDSLGNTAETDYMVTIISGESAELNKAELKIIDETDYTGKIGKALVLDVSTINFVKNPIECVGSITIPYTSYDTDLKLKVVAFDEEAHVQNLSETGLIGTNKKEITTFLLKDSNSEASISFKIVSKYGHDTKNYKINFKRGLSVKVSLELTAEILSGYNGGGKITLEWDYGIVEHKDTDFATFTHVAKNVRLKFVVKANEESKIGSIVSNATGHVINGAGKREINFNLEAKNDFKITVQFSPETTVKWINYKANGISEGYSSGSMAYDKNGATGSQVPTIVSNLFVVPKGCNMTFTISGLLPSYDVKEWKVNNESVTKTRDFYELQNNKCTLIVKNVEENLIVSVVTEIKIFRVNWSVNGGVGASIEAKKGNEIVTSTYDIEKGGSMTFKPKTIEGYKVKGWKVNNGAMLYGGAHTGGINITTDWVLRLTDINENKTVILFLEKIKHKLSVNIEGSMQGIKIKLNSDVYEFRPDEVNVSQTYQNIEHGTKINFEAVIPSNINYEMDKWECKKGDGTSANSSFKTGASENIKQLDMIENYTVTLKIKKKIGTKAIFRIKKIDTNFGQLQIRNKSNGSEIAKLITNGSEFAFETDGTKEVNVIVSGLDSKDKIVAWKDKDGNIISDNGLLNKGWYLNNVNFKPKVDDVIELNIARVSEIWFKKVNGYNGSYTININKSSSDTDSGHIFLPLTGFTIKKSSKNEDQRAVYMTKGTKIHISINGFPNTYKLSKWELENNSLLNFNISEWNINANEGKTDFDYICDHDGKALIVAKFEKKQF